MKIRLIISALFFASTVTAAVYGQAVPAGVATISPGPSPIALDGVLHYALSASEIAQLGYFGPGEVTASTTLSGDVAYASKSLARPFSLTFAGGVVLPNQSGQGVSTYQNLSVSQGYITQHWAFNLSDTFSFLPESPTTGLSGIAGVGDIGVLPVPGPGSGPAGGVLTDSGDVYTNSVTGSVARQITAKTSISGSGAWTVLHFLDANSGGLDDSQISGTVSANRRLNARSSASLSAVYSVFDYSGPEAGLTSPNIETRALNVMYQRLLSRTLSVSGTVGPEWVSSSNGELIPSSLIVSGNASLLYSRRNTNASLTYSRGINGGSGVLPGSLSDSVTFGAGRSYGRDWFFSINGAYTRSAGLTDLQGVNSLEGTPNPLTPVHEVFNTVYGGVEARRRIGNNLSGYLNYTIENQTTNYSLGAQNASTGTSHTFGIGISFAPRAIHLGQL